MKYLVFYILCTLANLLLEDYLNKFIKHGSKYIRKNLLYTFSCVCFIISIILIQEIAEDKQLLYSIISCNTSVIINNNKALLIVTFSFLSVVLFITGCIHDGFKFIFKKMNPSTSMKKKKKKKKRKRKKKRR